MSDAQPTEWYSTTFGSLCLRIVNGGTPETGIAVYWNGNTPWITGADFTSKGIGDFRRFVTDIGIRSSATSVVKQGNLLVVTRTGVGKLAVAPCDIAISQDITGIYIDTQKADTAFVYYLLSRELDELKKLNQGTSINGIVRSDLENHEVSIPRSLEAQKKLVAVFRGIDTAIEKTEALIAKHQQIKAGLMHDLFTRGVLPNGQLRPPRSEAPELYQETAIGWIPKTWSITRLNDAIGIIDCKHITPKYIAEGYPVIRPRNVKLEGLDFSDVEYVSEKDYRSLTDAHIPRAGDIVFSRNASFGVPAYIEAKTVPFAIGQDVVIMTQGAADTRFVYFSLSGPVLAQQVAARSGGSTFGRINLGEIRKLKLPLPDLDEQRLLATRLQAIDNEIQAVVASKNMLQQQKLGLMQDLLTGKVPVKVDGQTSATSDQALEQKVLSRLGERAQAMEVDIDAI